jgi:hypothetical protein
MIYPVLTLYINMYLIDHQEIPSELSYSELHFWSPFIQSSGVPSLPTAFSWLTGAGIYAGRLTFGNQGEGDEVAGNAQLFPLGEAPISIASTEFHFIVLFETKVIAICNLNHAVVYEQDIHLGRDEKVLGMTCDVSTNTFWVYTSLVLYEVLVRSEDRDVWKLFLKRQAFDQALSFAKVRLSF